MIDALVRNNSEYFSGFYYETAEDMRNNINGRYFEYEEIRGNAFSASQIVRNVLSVAGVSGIRTTWDLPFSVRKFVLLDGEKYIIQAVETFRVDQNPQVNFLFKNPLTGYYLQLTKIDNPKGVIQQ